MDILSGQGVCGGIAIGKITFYRKEHREAMEYYIEEPESEIKRLENAIGVVLCQLQSLHRKALAQAGENNAMIFEMHQMMLQDNDFQEAIRQLIRNERINAVWAVTKAGEAFAQDLGSVEDDYIKERAADVRDIVGQLTAVLSGQSSGVKQLVQPSIIVAEDLAPSETMQMDQKKVLAFVIKRASANSHTAILARTMNIPAVFDFDGDISDKLDGEQAIVDGFTGRVYICPDAGTLSEFTEKQRREAEKAFLLQQLKGKKAITRDGKRIALYANIGGPQDVASALENDAEGIGLFRSEFLYLGRENFPTEEEQFEVYKKVAQSMGDKKVIIRTIDIGTDKKAEYFGLEKEENPALGYRAIRLCLTNPLLFETQLRALLRASAFGNIAVMFPMIIAVEEIVEIKGIISRITDELDAAGIPYRRNMELGIMIETPAAVMISDLLAKEVDFFSIGTNDLTQYTLAIDRQNPKLDRFYNPHHPAITRMISQVVYNAHEAGIWVGICGELGADSMMTKAFLKMGIDELSVRPGDILRLKKLIREMDTVV